MAENKDASRTVAVIGLGSMGYGMAGALAAAGHRVRAYDVRADAVARFVDEFPGSAPAESPARAAEGADAIVVVVVNADQAEAALRGEHGVLAGARPGAVVISCPTMSPERARALASAVAEKGLLYLDAPISGGAQRAREGALTILASGSDEAFAKARPMLDAMAARLYELGPEPGTGAAFKMVNQLLAGVHIAAASEAITFAARLGLDLGKVYEVITASAGNSWMFENRIPHVLEGDYSPRSAVDIFTKDLGIIDDMARSRTFPVPVASAALQLFLMTAAAGMGKDDDASVARLYARIAGLDLPAPPA